MAKKPRPIVRIVSPSGISLYVDETFDASSLESKKSSAKSPEKPTHVIGLEWSESPSECRP